jgi:Sulfotransferase domain
MIGIEVTTLKGRSHPLNNRQEGKTRDRRVFLDYEKKIVAGLIVLSLLFISSGFLPKRQQIQGQAPLSKTNKHRRKKNLKNLKLLRQQNQHFGAFGALDETNWAKIDNTTCIPSNVSQSWQTRAPYVIILGAMKGGTRALSSYLQQHPRFVATQNPEIHFFDLHFDAYATRLGILQGAAQTAYAAVYKQQLLKPSLLQPSSHLLAIDDTPRYLFWSDRIPARVMCVSPWAKLIAILRDPVERAYSHYVYTLTENMSTKPKVMLEESFDEWIDHDLNHMQRSGLLEPDMTADQERLAWRRYLRTMDGSATTYAVLGKGMYALQLRHWFQAMDEVSKRRDDLLILEAGRMKERTDAVYSQVLEFLGVAPFQLLRDADNAVHAGNYDRIGPMKAKTRERLEKFFAPYNEQLGNLLGEEWRDVWKR